MIRALIDIIFRKHIFISLCGVLFFCTGYLLEGGTGSPGFFRFVLIFIATFLIYHFNTIGIGIVRQISARKLEEKKRVWGYVVYAVLGMLLLVLGFFISWSERFVLLVMAFLSILYNPPIDQQRLLLPLRSIPFLKIFLIGIVWSMLGSLYPWSVLGFSVQEAVVWRLFAGMFFFILGITLPFDVRDTEDDKSGGLPTVVHLFNMQTTRLLGVGAVMLAGVLIWPLYPVKIYLLMAMGCTAALVFAARPDRPFWYFQGFLDGTIPALYLATILSLNMQPVVQ